MNNFPTDTSQPLRLVHTSVSSFDNNCYLLCCGSHALLIDAANDAPKLLDMADAAGVSITGVLTTHSHHDHVRALKEVLERTGATHYASALDAPDLPAAVDVTLEHGDRIEFEGHSFPIIVLRGHTTGGACLVAELDGVSNLFIGDSLFPGGVGKTSSPAAFDQLFGDVTSRVFNHFPDETIIWPGHGKPTTLGAERPHLAEWYERKW